MFSDDLVFGEAFERAVINYKKGQQHYFKKVEGYFKEYDLICGCCQNTIECKIDELIYKTWNFCFEVPMLKNSRADYLAYGLYKKGAVTYVYEWRLEELKNWLRANWHNQLIIKTLTKEKNHEIILVNYKLMANANIQVKKYALYLDYERAEKQIQRTKSLF